MRTNSHFLIILMVIFLITGCSVKPEPINYGIDACSYCNMTIVDKTHASQVVTKKGKQYKYDAIECMANDLLIKNNEADLAVMQVSNYSQPGEMIKTSEAYFFISKAIKSPMGANLTAVSTGEAAEKIIAEQGGTRISWEELKEKFTAQQNKNSN